MYAEPSSGNRLKDDAFLAVITEGQGSSRALGRLAEWAGCLLGLIGAGLLASNSTTSRYGFVALLASSVCWIVVALAKRIPALLVMQLGFLMGCIFGIGQWLM